MSAAQFELTHIQISKRKDTWLGKKVTRRMGDGLKVPVREKKEIRQHNHHNCINLQYANMLDCFRSTGCAIVVSL